MATQACVIASHGVIPAHRPSPCARLQRLAGLLPGQLGLVALGVRLHLQRGPRAALRRAHGERQAGRAAGGLRRRVAARAHHQQSAPSVLHIELKLLGLVVLVEGRRHGARQRCAQEGNHVLHLGGGGGEERRGIGAGVFTWRLWCEKGRREGGGRKGPRNGGVQI